LRGYRCRKRRKINDRLSNMLELSLYNHPEGVLGVLAAYGMYITETKKGLRAVPKG
jgi:hypothetical protein